MNRFLDWLGYQSLMWLPTHIACNPYTWFGQWCLERAGSHAYAMPSPKDHVITKPERRAGGE